jgi:hypothetical protein
VDAVLSKLVGRLPIAGPGRCLAPRDMSALLVPRPAAGTHANAYQMLTSLPAGSVSPALHSSRCLDLHSRLTLLAEVSELPRRDRARGGEHRPSRSRRQHSTHRSASHHPSSGVDKSAPFTGWATLILVRSDGTLRDACTILPRQNA